MILTKLVISILNKNFTFLDLSRLLYKFSSRSEIIEYIDIQKIEKRENNEKVKDIVSYINL